MNFAQPFSSINLYKSNGLIDVLYFSSFNEPLYLSQFALEDKSTWYCELLHFAVNNRILIRSNKSEEILANSLKDLMLTQQLHIPFASGTLFVDHCAQPVERLCCFAL